jgi:hypothetical protein
MTLRDQFIKECHDKADGETHKVLTTAVKLPSGAIEIITNTQEIPTKIDYLHSAYDEEFRLKVNPNVQIVGYMLV